MSTEYDGLAEMRPLAVLGISEQEEHIYKWLLAHSDASLLEIARALNLTSGKVQQLLNAINAKGLATHSPGRPRRYIAISPDICLESIALKHQKNLQRARNAIQKLQEQAAMAQPHGDQEQMVELITSREAQRLIIEQIDRTAQEEVIALIRPPILISQLDLTRNQDQFTQTETRARGVRFRSIVDTEALALPGAVDRIWEDMKAGEDIRVYPHLEVKMVLVDRRIAIVPLNLQQIDSPSLLVRSSALLDALYDHFELLWERALPISFSSDGVMTANGLASRLPKGAEDLISLMAAGLNDKKIAYEMGISATTLKRRISEVMRVYGARTRFQLARLTGNSLSHCDNERE